MVFRRVMSGAGALISIGLIGFLCTKLFGSSAQVPLIVGSMGASAVLLFTIPASPLSQPWPVIGGNTISALVGVITLHLVPEPFYAAGLSVFLAIMAMSLTHSLHPPGGAAALTAVIGGTSVWDAGFWFPLVPVAANSILLVIVGWLFHRLSGQNYPYIKLIRSSTHNMSDPPPVARVELTSEDIEYVLRIFKLDIGRNNLDALLSHAEQSALVRLQGQMKCYEIMSKEIVSTDVNKTPTGAAHISRSNLPID